MYGFSTIFLLLQFYQNSAQNLPLTDCRQSRVCATYPAGCSGPDCTILGSIRPNLNHSALILTVTALNTGESFMKENWYAAFGIRIHVDNHTKPTGIFECVKAGDEMKTFTSYNTENSKPTRFLDRKVLTRSAKVENEELTCEFQIPLVWNLEPTNSVFDAHMANNFLALASGKADKCRWMLIDIGAPKSSFQTVDCFTTTILYIRPKHQRNC